MRERLVREKGRTGRGGRGGGPRWAGEEEPRGGGTRRIDPEVEVHWDPCHRVRTTSVHVEEGERAETVSGQTGHQRDDVEALSLNLRRQTHNPLVPRGLARKVQTRASLKYQSSRLQVCTNMS